MEARLEFISESNRNITDVLSFSCQIGSYFFILAGGGTGVQVGVCAETLGSSCHKCCVTDGRICPISQI